MFGPWRRAGAVLFAVLIGPAAVSSAQAAERAGVAAAVVGDITVTGEPRPEPVSARSGMAMLRFDRVLTRAESRMQILLRDQTTFSVGPKSELVIDKFVYEPEKGAGEIAAEFVEGVFRYVSGTVGQTQPENVQIDTGVGSIGVRGTSLFARQDSETGELFVGLLGPGGANNAGLNRGGFVFRNAQGQTRVLRSGYGVRVAPGEPPGPPVRIPDAILAQVQQSFQQRPETGTRSDGATTGDGADGQPSGASDAAQAAGDRRARARQLSRQTRDVLATLDWLERFRRDAVENGASRVPDDNPMPGGTDQHGPHLPDDFF